MQMWTSWKNFLHGDGGHEWDMASRSGKKWFGIRQGPLVPGAKTIHAQYPSVMPRISVDGLEGPNKYLDGVCEQIAMSTDRVETTTGTTTAAVPPWPNGDGVGGPRRPPMSKQVRRA